eukprot:scpid53016/ scgid34577/ Tripartite motif-containing protein 45
MEVVEGLPESARSDKPAELLKSVRCVACGQSEAESLKLLSCLHAMCVPCLTQYVNSVDATVSCFKCLKVAAGCALPGVRLEESLVDWPRSEQQPSGQLNESEASASAGGGHGSDGQPFCQNPECEGELEPAVTRCVECKWYLCDGHGRVHSRKRSSRNHQVVRLAAISAARQNVPSQLCPMHPHFAARTYCNDCRAVACEICERTHINCSPGLEGIQTAAERVREEWRTQLSDCSDSWRDKLDDAGDYIAVRTPNINSKIEALSKEISTDFEHYIKAVGQREHDLLNQLDAVRWKALKQLEKRADVASTKRYQLDACEFLIQKLDNIHLLAAKKILDKQIKDVVDCSEECLPDLPSDEDIDISYIAFATGGERGQEAELGDLVGRASQTGELKRTVFVHPAFDQFSCDASAFILSAYGHGIERCADSRKYAPVSTLGSYCHGVVECTMEVKDTGKGMFIGVTKENCKAVSECSRNDPFLGWVSFHGGNVQQYCVGSSEELGQPWQPGDGIVLRLDCDQRLLTGTHPRTGCRASVAVPLGKWCFAAEMNTGAKIRFLKKAK